jgi:aminopeptidase N
MTNSESIWQFGNNAYGKPATALNILRETIMGRELFDYAFKMYCERWKFKHPTPADFFRTMEDASAVDLDWFWRGWFYTTEHCDISLDQVSEFHINTQNPELEKQLKTIKELQNEAFIGNQRNKKSIEKTVNEIDPEIDDFYAKQNRKQADALDKKEYEDLKAKLSAEDLEILNSGKQFYELKFSNVGGLVMPIIVLATFEDGSTEEIRIPAEIWKRDEAQVSRVFIFDKKVKSFQVDPFLETADCDLDNNSWPSQAQPTRFELFQQQKVKENPMQRDKRVKELEGK